MALLAEFPAIFRWSYMNYNMYLYSGDGGNGKAWTAHSWVQYILRQCDLNYGSTVPSNISKSTWLVYVFLSRAGDI